jgi:hypothetical protein
MASSEWQEIYRSYTTEKLDEEIVKLQEDLDGGYSSQNSGGGGHTRDITELRNRLQAAIRVKERRGGRNQVKRVGRVDFRDTGRGDW